MLDNRNISNKHNNPNNERDKSDLEKRSLRNYSDVTSSSILGFGKLVYHPEKLLALKNGRTSFPITATLSLGNYCNHGCLWCSTAYFREAEATQINYQKLSSWLERATKRGLRGIGYVGNGEPLAFKAFDEIAYDASKLNLSQGIFTNGYLIDRYIETLSHNFTYVRVSLDAGSKEVHSELHEARPEHFDKILENISKLLSRRKGHSPTIGIQFATHQRNINDLEQCAKICSEIGVDYLSIKPVFDRGSVKDKIEKNSLTLEQYEAGYAKALAYENEHFKIYFRPQQAISENSEQNMLMYKKCHAAQFDVNVYENGDITGCGPHHIKVGDLDTDLVKLEENIKSLANKLDLKNCPAGCRYHALNYQLHKILNSEQFADVEHINLINGQTPIS